MSMTYDADRFRIKFGIVMDRGILVTAGLSAACWTLFHIVVNDKLLLSLMPRDVRAKAEVKKRSDRSFRSSLGINGVAFTHAILITPLVLSVALQEEYRTDIFGGDSERFRWANSVMMGYFVWDTLVCLKEYENYGATFLFHGVISMLATIVNATAIHPRMVFILAIFSGTEISTPALHIRWLLLQIKETRRPLFHVFNALFIALFILYRLLLVPVVSIGPFFLDCLKPYSERHTRDMSIRRRVCYVSVAAAWLVLNFYWAFLMVRTQVGVSSSTDAVETSQKENELSHFLFLLANLPKTSTIVWRALRSSSASPRRTASSSSTRFS